MAKSIKMASGNELHELNCLIERIEDILNTFSHVEEYIPGSFRKELKKVSDRVNKEWRLRYDD